MFRACPELRLHCLGFLGPAELGHVSCLDRSCAAVATSDALWRPLAERQWPSTQKLVQAGLVGSSFRALYMRRSNLDKATASVEEIEAPDPINHFALLIELRFKRKEVLSQVVEMNIDTEEPGYLRADLGRVASLVPLPVGEEAMDLFLSATLIRKSDGAFKTLGEDYINAPETLLADRRATFLLLTRQAALMSTDPADYCFDLFVSLTDQKDAVASLDTLRVGLSDVGIRTGGLDHPLPIKKVLACWAELGDWL